MKTKKANGNRKAKKGGTNGKKSLDAEKIAEMVDTYDFYNLFSSWFPSGLDFEGGKRYEAMLNPRKEAVQEVYNEVIDEISEFFKSHPEEKKGEERSLLLRMDTAVWQLISEQQDMTFITSILRGTKYMGATREQLKGIIKEWQRFSACRPHDEYLDRAAADI